LLGINSLGRLPYLDEASIGCYDNVDIASEMAALANEIGIVGFLLVFHNCGPRGPDVFFALVGKKVFAVTG
jgi:hypothetical protein